MKIKQLHLENYGRFGDLTIDFSPTEEKGGNVTVIVGNNGAGKSQILQALATGLSWFVNGLLYYGSQLEGTNREESEFIVFPHEGEYMKQSQIKNGKDKVEIDLSFSDVFGDFESLNINTTRRSILKPAVYGTNNKGFNFSIGEHVRKFQTNDKSSLPLISFYTVDRNVKVEIIQSGYSFMDNQLSAYEGFLNAGGNYDKFFQWFRDNEDIENEIIKNSSQAHKLVHSVERKELENQLYKLINEKEVIEEVISAEDNGNKNGLYLALAKITAQIDETNSKINQLLLRYNVLHSIVLKGEINQLNFVRSAVESFTNFKNPRIRRQGAPTMIVEKDGEELDVNQLSQGEKSLLALVGDIARRLAILNPSLEDPLKGEGVVMIDEVDLHLHPKWQHDLIDKLVKTFPKVQFILTTHSPHIVSDNPDVLVYALNDGELSQVPNVYGEDVNTVLTKVFDVPIRDSKAQEDFDEVAHLIHNKQFTDAERKIVELEAKMPENLELLRCRLHLTQAQLAQQQEG